MCPPLVFGAQKKPGLDRVNHFPSSSSFYLFVRLNFLLSSFLYQEMYQEMSELT